MMSKAEQVTGYMALKPTDIPDYNEGNEYFIANVVGNCMKHPDSPVNVGTGGKVLAHPIDLYRDFLSHWQRYVGKGIMFDIYKGQNATPLRMIKEFVRCDLGVQLVFKCYETDRPIYVAVNRVTGIAVVDRVLN